MKLFCSFLLSFFLFTPVHSATIAIIDSGFDLDHEYLKSNILQSSENEENIDFNGWDFFDNSHMKNPVIQDKALVQEILLFRNLRAKGYKQGLSFEEFEWFHKKSSDKNFMEEVRRFKKHSHGTFVAGIALREGQNINILPIRGLNIPNPVVSVNDNTIEKDSPSVAKTPEEKFLEERKKLLDRLTKKFSKITKFLSQKKIPIVNASYGITYKSVVNKFRERYKAIVGKEIEEEKLRALVEDYFRTLYERGEKTVRAHPDILFVFSAGNSGINNDSFHHYPSRIKAPNAISVAAMNGEYLATFSNFGQDTVDIGAPGVAILSIVPKVYTQDGNDIFSPASGTSMAAPYVANLAAQIMNTNPKLKPADVKKIILETGDSKEYLRTRLASGGVVNNKRAMRAALFSHELNIEQAIALGKSDLVNIEDRISLGTNLMEASQEMHKKVFDSIPNAIHTQEVEEIPEPEVTPPAPVPSLTKSESSSLKNQEKAPQDNLEQPVLTPPSPQGEVSDPAPANQNEEQSLQSSEEKSASSSEPQLIPLQDQSPSSGPSLPQS